jgi:hypothetical protein
MLKGTSQFRKHPVLILGVAGAYRCDEITNLRMGDIEDLDSTVLVKAQDTKSNKLRFINHFGKVLPGNLLIK